jgi:hypothetical protein
MSPFHFCVHVHNVYITHLYLRFDKKAAAVLLCCYWEEGRRRGLCMYAAGWDVVLYIYKQWVNL